MKFYKYSGLGNDFIIIDNTNNDIYMDGQLAKRMCNRYFGIGADGVVLASPSKTCDIRLDIYNSDGSRAEMCGNASRCFAKFVYEKKILNMEKFRVETLAGVIEPVLHIEDGKVKYITVDMGKPLLASVDIPFSEELDNVINYRILIDGEDYKITSMFMGVPHTVLFTDNLTDDYVVNLGRKIEISKYFPKKTNVNFVSVVDRKEIIVRTWERGAGYTLACGTGSCASVVAGILNKKLDKRVLVHLRGGHLSIEWQGENVLMTGEALEVFHGDYD